CLSLTYPSACSYSNQVAAVSRRTRADVARRLGIRPALYRDRPLRSRTASLCGALLGLVWPAPFRRHRRVDALADVAKVADNRKPLRLGANDLPELSALSRLEHVFSGAAL